MNLKVRDCVCKANVVIPGMTDEQIESSLEETSHRETLRQISIHENEKTNGIESRDFEERYEKACNEYWEMLRKQVYEGLIDEEECSFRYLMRREEILADMLREENTEDGV